MLLLGEANFSFALALTAALRWRGAVPDVLETATGAQRAAADAYLGLRPECRRPLHTLATGIESVEEVVAKYPESTGSFDRLRPLGPARVARPPPR